MLESIVEKLLRRRWMDKPSRNPWPNDSDTLAELYQHSVSERRAKQISPWRETWSYDG